MIELRNLTKSYRTPQGRKVLFKNVNAVFPEGKNIGILGRNGAGKSTLLRIMGGIDYPDSGRVITDERISWPMGLSSGFQGSMTGRENAAFICGIHGIWGESRRRVLDRVQDFAEIGDYFDAPVKTYSSGMRSRLAFGLSIAVDFDCYLVDEVMSVGDAHFKRKSEQVIAEKRKNAKFIIVSHAMGQLKKNCDVGIYLGPEGLQIYDTVDEAIARYQQGLPKPQQKKSQQQKQQHKSAEAQSV
ncbi:ABC transporter ATP-binding protein [Microbulbifer thermotolerans]|uniref:ABC transporter ATP-binding protein n=1 Tax=Microbulbifer thermotolerans TaxID=252514 RepID=A0AB35I064_MICTH|nr:ABC transporter ATP-binding protein [Microbulbifer thermotolerans]MCX2802172.1 ABC transporter ATP-binding protein [Microbulbifer thermotolerans]